MKLKNNREATDNKRVVDIHGHYVFGVDDGAYSLEMSLEMIESAYNQGAHHIFCTSHNSAHVLYYKRNLETLRKALKDKDLDVTLHQGCEIYCEEEYLGEIIEKLERGDLLPMGNSKYVLVEFAPWTTTEEIVNCVLRIRAETGFEPIIAHLERYLWLPDELEILTAIKEHSLPIQINAYSLTETSDEKVKSFARKLLQEKLVTFIGSDAHGTGHRPVKLESGIQYIHDNCNPQYAEAICYRNVEQMILNIATPRRT